MQRAPRRAPVSGRVQFVEPLERRQLLSGTLTPTPDADPVALAATTFAAAAAGGPMVTETNPVNGASNVRRDGFISADVFGPNGGIETSTLGSGTVFLTRNDTG